MNAAARFVATVRAAIAGRVRAAVFAMVDFGGQRPWTVFGVALAVLAACAAYTTRLEVRSDIRELLPRDSPGFVAFERRLERIGGRATILVLVQSPERAANERFVDELRGRLESMPRRELVSWIESDTKEARRFLEDNKWLYASLSDLEEADAKVERQIALRGGLVEDLESDDDASEAEPALGAGALEEKFTSKAKSRDDFPTGYFASPDGTQIALRIFSTTSGLGGGGDQKLFEEVRAIVNDLRPDTFHPAMTIGFGGDIPNTMAEKDALVHEAMIATAIAAVLILAGLVWFYRSVWALFLVGFPPIFGIACAYAFATLKYGYVNASGAFLGAIILGNGINYPIVLYSRYKEFRARDMTPEVARRESVWNAFRAELVGSGVASIAYGSLTVTRFRGFSQFGVIGFVGMLLVWISMIPCLPALIVLIERLQLHVPRWLRERPAKVAADGSRGPIARFIGDVTARWPRAFVFAAAVVTVVLAWRLPGYLADPWEYDFDKLGSESARKTGAYHVTAEAERILSGNASLSGSLVLADRPEHADAIKAQILAKDAADPAGSMVESITTIDDILPGTRVEQEKKLEVLDRLRERLSPRVLASLSEEERAKVMDLMPPTSLRVLGPKDLPELLERRFSERDGTLGTVLYLRYRPELSRNDGHVLLRQSALIDSIELPDGTQVESASRATVFAEMIKSLERDGPLATVVAFCAVALVVVLATSSRRGTVAVLLALVLGVTWMLGFAAIRNERLNFLDFIALPITFGIGSEYPFNIFDRSRLLGGDVTRAVKLHLGAVTLCSYTTIIGYGSLVFSDNQALRSFGRLAASGEMTCLFAALLFLPALLHMVGLHKVGRTPALEETGWGVTRPKEASG